MCFILLAHARLGHLSSALLVQQPCGTGRHRCRHTVASPSPCGSSEEFSASPERAFARGEIPEHCCCWGHLTRPQEPSTLGYFQCFQCPSKVLRSGLGDLSNLWPAISHLIPAVVVGSSAFCLSLFEGETNACSGGCATAPWKHMILPLRRVPHRRHTRAGGVGGGELGRRRETMSVN